MGRRRRYGRWTGASYATARMGGLGFWDMNSFYRIHIFRAGVSVRFLVVQILKGCNPCYSDGRDGQDLSVTDG